MKRLTRLFNLSIVLVLALLMSSCISKKSLVIPTAVSSINDPISLKNLNLTKDQYQIINTETAEASVEYEEAGLGIGKKIKITEANNEYTLIFKPNESVVGGYEIKYDGIVKVGYLYHDQNNIRDIGEYYKPDPSWFATGLAIYRLINSVQEQGADGIIEPVITMKVGEKGKKVIYTATISAKLVKIKTK